jgi:hypothetical protein
MNCLCGASVNPRWPKCLACDRPLTLPETPSLVLPSEAKARRFKVTLKSGGVLLHSRPGGLTRGEAIELSKDWGEVAECVPAVEGNRVPVPVLTQLEVSKPVSLDLTLVRCADCVHFERIDRPHIGRCTRGHGWYWLWDTDRRRCKDFDEKVPVRKNHIFAEEFMQYLAARRAGEDSP